LAGDSGAVAPAGYRREGDRTVVRWSWGHEAVFVVSPGRRRKQPRVPPARARISPSSKGPGGRVSGGQGAGGRGLAAPGSWSENADAGVRYFSARRYSHRLTAPKAWFKPGRLVLDLGAVKESPRSDQRKPRRQAWKPPYRLDVTDAEAGDNRLTVKVTNLWAIA